jgi:DNA-binding CsgD family transcriptional regulator
MNIEPPRRGKRQPERDKLIEQLFLELKSTRLVADRIGLTVNVVNHALRRRGVPTPRVGRLNPYSACNVHGEKLLQLCEQGLSLKQMAKIVKTSPRHVLAFLRSKGVTKVFDTAKYGEDHYLWKGRLIDKDGYVLIHVKGHPNARKHTNYIFEHRLVMEEHLGRILLPTEVIHHINGQKQDNRIENLQLFQSNGDHLAVDLKGKCPKWTEEGKARIRKAVSEAAARKRNANRKG